MDQAFYQRLADDALAGVRIDRGRALRVLTDDTLDLMPLLNAAYTVRHHHHGRRVQVHVLNNAQNGRCPEDCGYCSQARTSAVAIADYALKSESEILDEARRAYEGGAFRYCMVFAGRGPSAARTARVAELVRKIKAAYPIEVCVSAGLLDEPKARALADAGLDRLNHNLNTSRSHYPSICTTHTYDDRLGTLRAARSAGLEVCSGLIAGMGEPPEDLVEIAGTLRDMEAESIPVNFLLPFEGGSMRPAAALTPTYCLRVLCLFRLLNPRAEVRCAAGREFHLRAMEPLCLYPANSLFIDGYLNGRGAARIATLRMIVDAGFEIVSDRPVDALLAEAEDEARSAGGSSQPTTITVHGGTTAVKTRQELRPSLGAV